MLIIFGGLPGVGKTTIAREIARRLSCVYVRIDTIEQAIQRSTVMTDVGPAGYLVGYALAKDNLIMGSIVVADSVNPLEITRDAWISTAAQANAHFLEIEVICSDGAEHRRRVETRLSDIDGHVLPSWQDVLERDYEPWSREHMVIDTASAPVSDTVNHILREFPNASPTT